MSYNKRVQKEYMKGLITIIIGVVAFIAINELVEDNDTANSFSILSIGVVCFGAGKMFTALNFKDELST